MLLGVKAALSGVTENNNENNVKMYSSTRVFEVHKDLIVVAQGQGAAY